jgi:hypothetical protein
MASVADAVHMSDEKPVQRYQILLSDAFWARVDEWRRRQPRIPTRAHAFRTLIEIGARTQFATARFEDVSQRRHSMALNEDGAPYRAAMARSEKDGARRPYHIGLTDELWEMVDGWRRTQPEIPTRAASLRMLAEFGLTLERERGKH